MDEDTKEVSLPYANASHGDICNAVEPRECQQHDIDDSLYENAVYVFLHDWKGSIPSWEAKIIQPVFSSENDAVSTSGNSIARAWLDDHRYSVGSSRNIQAR